MSGSGSTGILVLGMHRSGTSAIAGALGRCGVELGDHLVAPAADNPLGYFEHADAVVANEVLLDALDRAWDDVRELPAGWQDSAAAAEASKAIGEILDSLATSRLWAVKDPRMCRLLPLWLPSLRARSIEPVGVLALRHPGAVAASLATRDRMPRRIALLSWLRHTLEATAAAPARSTVLRYDDLVADPVSALDAVGRALTLPLRIEPDALRPFVDRSARHHDRADVASPGDAWEELAQDVFDALDRDPDWRARLPALRERFARLAEHESAWIEVAGGLQRAADRRRRSDFQARVAVEARAEHVQVALDAASATAERHLEALRTEASRVVRAEQALEAATMLANERAATVESLTQDLAAAHRAIAQAEALVAERTREAAEAHRALAQAEALVAERTGTMESLASQLAATEQAKDAAEGLALARLDELQVLAGELERTQAGLARAEALVQSRNEELGEARMRVAHQRVRMGDIEERLHRADAALRRIRGAHGWPLFARLNRIEADGDDD
jgi:hypothetical protein